jgi:hypothetical protein
MDWETALIEKRNSELNLRALKNYPALSIKDFWPFSEILIFLLDMYSEGTCTHLPSFYVPADDFRAAYTQPAQQISSASVVTIFNT